MVGSPLYHVGVLSQIIILITHSITEDPTILSGTLRSTLDIFEEYEDAEIVRPPNFDSDL